MTAPVTLNQISEIMSEIMLNMLEDKKRIAALEAERDSLREQVEYLRGLLTNIGER